MRIKKQIINNIRRENQNFSAVVDSTKTEIIVKLIEEYEKSLISRSVAKRILNNLEKFKEITFDYKGIENIGQGFADQIYRVFQNENPEVILNNINTNKEIEFMINRSKRNK